VFERSTCAERRSDQRDVADPGGDAVQSIDGAGCTEWEESNGDRRRRGRRQPGRRRCSEPAAYGEREQADPDAEGDEACCHQDAGVRLDVGELADRIVDRRQLAIVDRSADRPSRHERDRSDDAADRQAPLDGGDLDGRHLLRVPVDVEVHVVGSQR
jgi:hypothetical protein